MKKLTIGLIGNPNSGKTTLFNQLTGARQRVGNWAGVTVERKEGQFSTTDHQVTLVDLPGTYSLTTISSQTLLGQKLSPYDAACAGCVAHGAAADVLAARFGTRGMLATDLFSTLQRIVNPEVTDKNHDESSNSAP